MDDPLHVFTNIARFCEGGRIRDGQGDLELARQRLDEQRVVRNDEVVGNVEILWARDANAPHILLPNALNPRDFELEAPSTDGRHAAAAISLSRERKQIGKVGVGDGDTERRAASPTFPQIRMSMVDPPHASLTTEAANEVLNSRRKAFARRHENTPCATRVCVPISVHQTLEKRPSVGQWCAQIGFWDEFCFRR